MERITNKKWLQQKKNLLGKTLCIIDRGFNGVDKSDLYHFRPSSSEYCIDITKIEPDPMKAVDYIYGKSVIYVNDVPPIEGFCCIPEIGRYSDCISIDYFNAGVFEKYEYWIMTREEAIEQIKGYNQQIVEGLYEIL